jgi:hypothetical protein
VSNNKSKRLGTKKNGWEELGARGEGSIKAGIIKRANNNIHDRMM